MCTAYTAVNRLALKILFRYPESTPTAPCPLELLQAGPPHTFTLKGRSLPNGTYFVRITGKTFTEARLTTLLK